MIIALSIILTSLLIALVWLIVRMHRTTRAKRILLNEEVADLAQSRIKREALEDLGLLQPLPARAKVAEERISRTSSGLHEMLLKVERDERIRNRRAEDEAIASIRNEMTKGDS